MPPKNNVNSIYDYGVDIATGVDYTVINTGWGTGIAGCGGNVFHHNDKDTWWIYSLEELEAIKDVKELETVFDFVKKVFTKQNLIGDDIWDRMRKIETKIKLNTILEE
jgi:hypothetical protein